MAMFLTGAKEMPIESAADSDLDKKQRRRDVAKQFIRGQSMAFETISTKLDSLPTVVDDFKNVLSVMQENHTVATRRAPVVYTKIPEVEVRVIVHRIESVEPAEMRFKADFSVQLAWCDTNIATDGVCPTPADWASGDLFNPQLVILNAETQPISLGDGHLEPPLCTQAQAGGAWLRKTARFRAVLVLEKADLGYFPYDLHELPIKLGVKIPHGVRVEAGVSPKMILKQPTQSGLGQADVWHRPPDAKMTMTMDFSVVGMFYDAGIDDAGNYCLRFLVKRNPGIRGSEILIINSLPFLAMGTLWESTGLLTNRLIIVLLLMIALVIISGRRPQELHMAPCWTVYDRCCHEALFIVAMVALQNIVSSVFYQRCGDSDEGACRCQSSCGRAWCGARTLDCYSFPVLVALHCFLGFFPFLRARVAALDSLAAVFRGNGKSASSVVPAG